MSLEQWDYYELIDDIGQAYYRWDAEQERMEWLVDGEWIVHHWTPASLLRYDEMYDDVTLTVVTADDVR